MKIKIRKYCNKFLYWLMFRNVEPNEALRKAAEKYKKTLNSNER